MSMTFLFLGGGVGTMLRFAVVSAVREMWHPEHFPLGTLAVNVAGCLAIGALWQALAGPWAIREELRVALIVGLLGGFTTFSSFGLETIQMWSREHYARAILYVVLSNGLGIAAVFLGMRLVPGAGDSGT